MASLNTKLYLLLSPSLLMCNSAYATPFTSGSLEGMGAIVVLMAIIITPIALCCLIWLYITWRNLNEEKVKKFYKLKTYIILSVALVVSSGICAFTLHYNAPYTPNLYFLSFSIAILLATAITLYIKLFKNNENT